MGGGPSTPATTTSTQTQELPMWAIPSAYNALTGGERMVQNMRYQPYGGQRIAGPVGLQQQIKSGTKAAISPGLADINRMRNMYQATAAGNFMGGYTPQYNLFRERGYTPGQIYTTTPYQQGAGYQGGQYQQGAGYQGGQYQRGASLGTQGYQGGTAFESDAYRQGYKDPASNPWLKRTYQQASRDIVDQYAKGTAASRNAAAVRAGAMGGSAAAELAAMDEYGLGENLKNLATDIYGQNYQQERAREFAWQQQAAEQGFGSWQQTEAQRNAWMQNERAAQVAAWQQNEAQRAAFQQQNEQQQFGAWGQNEAQRAAYQQQAEQLGQQSWAQNEAQRAAYQQQAEQLGQQSWAQNEAQRAAYQQQAAQLGQQSWAQNEAQRAAFQQTERDKGYQWMSQEAMKKYDWMSAERQRQLQATQALGGLAGAQQQLYTSLQGQADFRQQLAQQGLDTRYADFLERRDFPLLKQDVLGSVLSQSLGHAGGTTTTLNQGYYPGSGGFGSAIGGALGGGAVGYGIGNQFFGGGASSGVGTGLGALLGGLGSYFG